jgi:Fic family protein
MGKRTQTARAALNVLYKTPLVSSADLERALEISTPTSNTLIRELIRVGVLVEITGQRRGRIYAFDRYLKLFVS